MTKEELIKALEIRIGSWKKISPAGIYECSKCSQNVLSNDISIYKYCFRCGAMMYIEEEENDD